MGNTNMSKNIIESREAVTNQSETVLSGVCGETVRFTLPKGSYTIDGDGNLTIHGDGAISDRKKGRMLAPLYPSLSYGEFMEKMGGCGAESRKDDCENPFGMEFSALCADPEKMVRECEGTVYGYARVSTDHQDYQRQIDALLKFGIREENIFKDKKSGKDFKREEFQKLMLALQPGDCIVVVELDRFGRSMREIRNHWFWITQQKQANIIVLDQPVLNTRPSAHGLSNFLADLVLAVFSLMAEIERNLINKRMEIGIKRARLAGRKLGRRLMEIPPLFWKLKEKFLDGLISQNMASRELGVDPKTFRSWVERTGNVLDAQEWETLKVGIEEQEKEERIWRARIEYGEMSESDSAEAGQKATTAVGQKMNAGCAVTVEQDMPVDVAWHSGRRDNRKIRCHGLPKETKEQSLEAESMPEKLPDIIRK